MVTLRSELSLRPHLCQQYKPLYVPSGAQAKGPRCCDSLDSDLILPIIIITCLHDSQGMNLAFLNSCHIVFLSRKTKVDFPLVSNILVHYRKLQSMIPNTTTTFKKKNCLWRVYSISGLPVYPSKDACPFPITNSNDRGAHEWA